MNEVVVLSLWDANKDARILGLHGRRFACGKLLDEPGFRLLLLREPLLMLGDFTDWAEMTTAMEEALRLDGMDADDGPRD
jgi:hypothetical protein